VSAARAVQRACPQVSPRRPLLPGIRCGGNVAFRIAVCYKWLRSSSRRATEVAVLEQNVTQELAREAAGLLSIADASDVRSLHRLTTLAARQVAACSGQRQRSGATASR